LSMLALEKVQTLATRHCAGPVRGCFEQWSRAPYPAKAIGSSLSASRGGERAIKFPNCCDLLRTRQPVFHVLRAFPVVVRAPSGCGIGLFSINLKHQQLTTF
jgi:hypothetical protein